MRTRRRSSSVGNSGIKDREWVRTPIEVTAYKVGDKYYGSRSDEFGYANYEIIPAVKELNPLGPSFIDLR
jgi:hypothetical protein